MTERIAVLLYGEVVGHLERSDVGQNPSFAYDKTYVHSGGVALSARLPLSTATFEPERVAAYLLGLLPENLQTRERWAGRLGISPDDSFGMLARMGWDCPGAVKFCAVDDVADLRLRETAHMPVAAHARCVSIGNPPSP